MNGPNNQDTYCKEQKMIYERNCVYCMPILTLYSLESFFSSNTEFCSENYQFIFAENVVQEIKRHVSIFVCLVSNTVSLQKHTIALKCTFSVKITKAIHYMTAVRNRKVCYIHEKTGKCSGIKQIQWEETVKRKKYLIFVSQWKPKTKIKPCRTWKKICRQHLKSIHFKKTVVRISFLSKLW